jgi:hypothetical protein
LAGGTGWAYPVVAEGKLFIGAGGYLNAFDENTGSFLWQYRAAAQPGYPCCAAVSEGRVFYGTGEPGPGSCMYALNTTTGEQLWNFPTELYVRSPVVAENKLYFGVDDWDTPNQGKIYCLDAVTGAQIWNYTTQDKGVTVARAPGRVVIEYQDELGGNWAWDHNFLPSDNNERFGRTNFDYVTRNEWYHYVSPNLLNVTTTKTGPHNAPIDSPTPYRITRIYVGGAGWDFNGRFDDVQLLAVPGVPDIAVVEVVPYSNWVYQGGTVAINVTVLNQGTAHAEADLTLYYNLTANQKIAEESLNLGRGEMKTLTFNWTTKGVAYCHNYTLTAVADVKSDANYTNNILASTLRVKVRIVGDVNGDGKVDMADISIAARAFGSTPEREEWNVYADVTGPVHLKPDGLINLRDIAMIANNFGSKC